MADRQRDIPALLHDARLTNWDWDSHLQRVRWCFTCLRRNEDGSPVEDTTVELLLSGVERIEAYYAPAACDVKPSEFAARDRLLADDLAGWVGQPTEAVVAFDSSRR